MDVVASAEYLRRGAQGRIVLRLERGLPVDGPGHASVGPLAIDEGVDLKISAEVPRTRWNGTFAVRHGGKLAFERLYFASHFAAKQGAVVTNNGSMVVSECLFENSRSLGVGGAIVNREAGELFIRSTIFRRNSAMFGGALFNYNGQVIIEKSTFQENRAQTAGGAIAMGPASVLIVVETDFVNNIAAGEIGNSVKHRRGRGADVISTEPMGDAVIWSSHQATAGDGSISCANGTSLCWNNARDLTLPIRH
eukprot:COSAG01_NODE_1272_length_10952_cov_8.029301_5_plen_251_part_00